MFGRFNGFSVVVLLGEKGGGVSTGKPLHYKGSKFHRIIKGFMAQVCYPCYLYIILDLNECIR